VSLKKNQLSIRQNETKFGSESKKKHKKPEFEVGLYHIYDIYDTNKNLVIVLGCLNCISNSTKGKSY